MVCASAFISFIVVIIGSLGAHRAGKKVGVVLLLFFSFPCLQFFKRVDQPCVGGFK